jgi:FAD binding domain-containing protein
MPRPPVGCSGPRLRDPTYRLDNSAFQSHHCSALRPRKRGIGDGGRDARGTPLTSAASTSGQLRGIGMPAAAHRQARCLSDPQEWPVDWARWLRALRICCTMNQLVGSARSIEWGRSSRWDERYRLVLMGSEQFDVIIVGAGFGGIGAAIQLSRLGYDNVLIWAERGTSTTTRALLSTSRRPRFRTGLSRTRPGRGCMPPAPN